MPEFEMINLLENEIIRILWTSTSGENVPKNMSSGMMMMVELVSEFDEVQHSMMDISKFRSRGTSSHYLVAFSIVFISPSG